MKIKFHETSITRTIEGVELTFYPCKTKMLHRLREAGGPLVQALMQMTAPQMDPGGSKVEEIINTEEQSAGRIMRTENLPIPLPVLEAQARERLKGARELTDALLSDTALELVKDLLADSLRMSDAERADIDEWPVTALLAALPAWAEAQANIPFVQQARALFSKACATAEARLGALQNSSTTPKPGSPSSTGSTLSLVEDTPPTPSEN